jgi:hypothetical protein
LERETNPTWDYFKLLLFVVFLTELVLFLMGVIFGRLLGYSWAFMACFWLGVVVAACYGLIVLANMLLIACQKVFRMIKKSGSSP